MSEVERIHLTRVLNVVVSHMTIMTIDANVNIALGQHFKQILTFTPYLNLFSLKHTFLIKNM